MDANDFVDGVQKALARRKLELSRVRLALRDARRSTSTTWISRSGAVLAYAHWEGHVKSEGSRYIKYINGQKVRASLLQLPLQAACVASHFVRANGSRKINYLGEILREIDQRRSEVFNGAPEKIADTNSNLSSTTFRAIVEGLGLEYLPHYATREAAIDSKLVLAKNQVAHGEMVEFTVAECIDRIDTAVGLMDDFSAQLITAVRDGAFLLAAPKASALAPVQ